MWWIWGSFGEIGRDTRPVMHVLSYSRALPPNLKWRGAALSHFDGKRWFEPPVAGKDIPVIHGTAEVADRLQRSRRDGRRLLYRVDVGSSDTGTLFVAGIPEYINVSVAAADPDARGGVPGAAGDGRRSAL